MRRLNPWVVGSVSGSFVAGAFIGWIVTRLGCEQGTCAQSAIVIGAVAGFVAAIGVGIVVVLADRSMREWRDGEHSANQHGEPDSEIGEAESP